MDRYWTTLRFISEESKITVKDRHVEIIKDVGSFFDDVSGIGMGYVQLEERLSLIE